jgi:chlorophyllide a reductase subunit Y
MVRKRTVGYVPFNSETLVTGKLFEDIRDAVFELAEAGLRRRRRHQSVRAHGLRRAAAAAAQRDQRRAHHRHRRAGLWRADPCRSQGRAGRCDAEVCPHRGDRAGPGAGAQPGRAGKPTVTLVGEMFPADPVTIGNLLEPMGLAAGPVVPTREWRELYSALDCAAVAAIHPFYTASFREFEAAGRPITGSAPVGRRWHRRWLEAIGKIAECQRQAD